MGSLSPGLEDMLAWLAPEHSSVALPHSALPENCPFIHSFPSCLLGDGDTGSGARTWSALFIAVHYAWCCAWHRVGHQVSRMTSIRSQRQTQTSALLEGMNLWSQPAGWREALGCAQGTCGPRPTQQPGLQGLCTTTNPYFPHASFLSQVHSGWGTPIVSLSGSQQTEKGFLEPLGSPRSPSSVWWSIRTAFLCPAPSGPGAGFGRPMATVKIARAASIVPALIRSPRWLSRRLIVGRLGGT
jgi:hypothetical protein